MRGRMIGSLSILLEERYTENEILELQNLVLQSESSPSSDIPYYTQRKLLLSHTEYNNFSEKDYPSLNGTFTYNFRGYQPPEIANGLSGAVRFGHSTNFASVVGSDEEKTDYIVGLLWLGIVVAIIFLFWLLVIVLFYLLGPNRVGFLSGSPFYRSNDIGKGKSLTEGKNEIVKANDLDVTKDTKQSEYQNSLGISSGNISLRDISFQNCHSTEFQNDTSNDLNNISHTSFDNKLRQVIIEENEKLQTKSKSIRQSNVPKSERNGRWRSCCGIDQIMWLRGIFILSGIIVILFAILFVTQGLANFQRSVDTINSVADTTMYLASQATDFIRTGTLAIHKDLAPLIKDLQTELEASSLCPNVTDAVGVDDVLQKFRDVASQAVVALNTVDAFIESNDFNDILSTLGSSHRMSQKVYDFTGGIDFTSWQSLLVLVLYTPIPCLLVASAILSVYDTKYPRFHCFVVWVLFPAFFILTIVAAIFCSASIITTSGNSDFCHPAQYNTNSDSLIPELIIPKRENVMMNAPDVSVFQILQKLGVNMQSDAYIIAAFYITQCFLRNPFAATEAYLIDLQDGKEIFRQLMNNLIDTDTIQTLSTLCGRDFDGMEKTVNDVQALVSLLVKSVRGLIDLLGCDKIVPIYQATIYDASCQESLKALIWIFSSSLIVASFGLLMITLRAAYSVTEYGRTDVDVKKQNAILESENDELETNYRESNYLADKPHIPLVASEDQFETDDDNSSQNDRFPKTVDVSKLYATNSSNQYNEVKPQPNNEIIFDDWTPSFPSETKAVGDEIDRILDELCKSRSYDDSWHENIEVRRTGTP